MRANQIKVGGRYEVKAGRSTTVVKVKSVNKKTGGFSSAISRSKSSSRRREPVNGSTSNSVKDSFNSARSRPCRPA